MWLITYRFIIHLYMYVLQWGDSWWGRSRVHMYLCWITRWILCQTCTSQTPARWVSHVVMLQTWNKLSPDARIHIWVSFMWMRTCTKIVSCSRVFHTSGPENEVHLKHDCIIAALFANFRFDCWVLRTQHFITNGNAGNK